MNLELFSSLGPTDQFIYVYQNYKHNRSIIYDIRLSHYDFRTIRDILDIIMSCEIEPVSGSFTVDIGWAKSKWLDYIRDKKINQLI
jgi:hypothetical protein